MRLIVLLLTLQLTACAIEQVVEEPVDLASKQDYRGKVNKPAEPRYSKRDR